jgi:hypothetical protein
VPQSATISRAPKIAVFRKIKGSSETRLIIIRNALFRKMSLEDEIPEVGWTNAFLDKERNTVTQ